jgi:hypothetical protein
VAIEFKTYKADERVKIKFIAATVCDGRDVDPGDVVECSKGSAVQAIAYGKAVEFVPEPEVVAEPVAGKKKK